MKENYSDLFIRNRIEDVPVSQLDLSPRAYNMLRINGIRSLSGLCTWDADTLEGLPYSNQTVAREIEACLYEYLRDPRNVRSGPTPAEENAAGTPEATEAAPAEPTETEPAEPAETEPEQPAQTAAEPVPDERPLEAINLSVRAYNCLKRAKINTVQQLLDASEEDLLRIRMLGQKSLDELTAFRANYTPPEPAEAAAEEPAEPAEAAAEEPAEPAEAAPAPASDERPLEELDLSVRTYNCLKHAKIYTVQQLLDASEEDLARIRNLGRKSLDELAAFRAGYTPPVPTAPKTAYSVEELKPLLLGAFQQPFHGLSFQEFRDAMPEAAGDETIRKAVGALLAEGRLEYVDFRCYRVYPSFYEYYRKNLDSLDERAREVLTRRYGGETLDAIGTAMGITRERVRQIFIKQQRRYLNQIKAACKRDTGSSVFAEDFYKTLYESCDLPDEFWTEELGLPADSIRYLSSLSPRGRKKPEEILRDEAIPVSLRYRVRNFLDRDKIRLDGKLFPRSRVEIEDYAMRKYAQEEITFERFAQLYNGMLEDEGIPFDEKIYLTEAVIRTRNNRIADSRCCLWKQRARLRWYDIDARDYTALLDTLNLSGYRDTEVSTRKFMNDYPELMEDYDIRDAYELHNLLKKISDRYALDFINFSRQPILQFGQFDRNAAIREAMFALAPVTQQDLLEYLYLEYGYDKLTALGYLTPLSVFYHNGVFSVDFKQIPPQRAQEFLSGLTEDFYFLDELKRLYQTQFPDADREEINPYSIKALGFLVNSGYAVRNYATAYAYFTALLTKEDLYDIRPILRRYGSIRMFTQTYEELLKTRRIFRFEKDRIISARRLERLNVTGEQMEDYCAAVGRFAEEDSYFTIFSLRQDGFEHPLDMLGLDDYFYASLLATDGRFSSCQMFGMPVLYNGSGERQLSRRDFLLTQLQEYDSVEPEEFMQDIKDRFGLTIPDRYEVTGAVRDSELYYDTIMDRIYRDKSLYYADLDE